MSNLLAKNYTSVLAGLKEKIRSARLKAVQAVNREMLMVYWEIGNTILVQQRDEGWGAKVIDRLAADLKIEFPDFKGLSSRNLKYMRAFAEAYPQFIIVQQAVAQLQNTDIQGSEFVQVPLAQLNGQEVPVFVQAELAQLPWYHHITLLDKVKDSEQRKFYIRKAIQNGWSRNILVHQIESGLHNRQGKAITNFNTTIPENSDLVQQMFKDPYKLEFIALGAEAAERDLENALMDHLTKTLLELGDGFAFKGRQFKLVAGEQEFFLDLLFYHTGLRRYIVVELKIGEFKAEYVGKMNAYLGMVDDHFAHEKQEPSIGLILCKTKDKIVAEYALRDTKKPIGIAEYRTHELLPDNIKGSLPSVEDLQAEMEKEYDELKNPSEKKLDRIKELMSKLKSEKIIEKKNDEKSKYLFHNVFLPQQDKLWHALLNDIVPLFQNIVHSWRVENYGFGTFEAAREQLLKVPSAHEFQYELRLEGFLDAGINTFNCYVGFKFYLDHYHYHTHERNDLSKNHIYKKLYHQNPTHDEMTVLVEQCKMNLLSQIEQNLERITEEGK